VDAATYTATERLRDGRAFEIRALRPNDEADLLAAVGRIGAQSLYRRFMGAKSGFSEKSVRPLSTSISSIMLHWSQS
jgi:hypothetical protein